MKTYVHNQRGEQIRETLKTWLTIGIISIFINATQAVDIFSEDDMTNGSIPHIGSSVIAFGWGDTFWNLQDARIEALDNLNEEKQRIEAGLRPGLWINWGQISETSASNWGGHTVFLSQPGEVRGAINNTAQSELTLMMMAAENAMATATEDLSGIGYGWGGNVTHLGPHCNVVHDYFFDEISGILESHNLDPQYYSFVTLFEEGVLPYDLAAHVYFGIINVQTGELIYIFDPWRTGNVDPIDPSENPNGDPEQIIPW